MKNTFISTKHLTFTGHADHVVSVGQRPIFDLYVTCNLGPLFGHPYDPTWTSV